MTKVEPETPSIASKRIRSKLPALELLRFAAAMCVLLFHYQHFVIYENWPGPWFDVAPGAFLLQPIYIFGHFAVQIFWALSGFVFFSAYYDRIRERTLTGGRFAQNRLARLYPLSIATLLIVAALQFVFFAQNGKFFIYQENTADAFFLQLFMISSWGPGYHYSFNGPVWSVSVEILIYIIFFLLIRSRLRLIVVHLIVWPVVIILLLLGGTLPFIWALGFFFAGGIAFSISRLSTTRRRALTLAGASALACVVVVVAVRPVVFRVFDDATTYRTVLLLIALIPALVLLSLWRPKSVLLNSGAQLLGNLTYSSYLLHFPVQLAVVIGFGAAGFHVPWTDTRFFLIFFAVVLGLSYLCYRYFERPLENRINSHTFHP